MRAVASASLASPGVSLADEFRGYGMIEIVAAEGRVAPRG